MIVDSSAIVAIVTREPGYDVVLEQLGRAQRPAIGTPTLTEAAIVLSARLRKDARSLLSRLLAEAGVEVVPFGEAHFSVAVEAWLRFGKGRHPASLNSGDCMSYAVAKLADVPLLCVGDDFARTDLALA